MELYREDEKLIITLSFRAELPGHLKGLKDVEEKLISLLGKRVQIAVLNGTALAGALPSVKANT